MKKFQFKLESVLQERKRNEDLKLREWTIVAGMLDDLRTELKKLETRLHESMKEENETLSLEEILPGLLSESENFISGLKLKIEWKKNEISRAEKFVEKKRQEWTELRKKRAILDKFKEIQFKKYKEEKKKSDNRALDDIYVMRQKPSEEDVA